MQLFCFLYLLTRETVNSFRADHYLVRFLGFSLLNKYFVNAVW
jgi:hypothetical protein